MTDRQNELLAFVALFMREHQRTPSHGTIAKAMNCSKQNVTKILQALERKGVLTVDRTGTRQKGFAINLKGAAHVENTGSEVQVHSGSQDGHSQDVCQDTPGAAGQAADTAAISPAVPAKE